MVRLTDHVNVSKCQLSCLLVGKQSLRTLPGMPSILVAFLIWFGGVVSHSGLFKMTTLLLTVVGSGEVKRTTAPSWTYCASNWS